MSPLLRPAIVMVTGFTLLTGIALPLAMTGIAQAVFPREANGSLIERDGVVVGSALIAQGFSEPRYFAPRASNAGTGYDGAASGATNLGPTSAALLTAVKERIAGEQNVPADAATTSGSGLDPHISPANAARQVARVAAARGLPEERVRALLAEHTEGRAFGLVGEPRVNVLELNLALDALR